MILENGVCLVNTPNNIEVLSELLDWASDTAPDDQPKSSIHEGLNDATYASQDLRTD
jgi:hypothetical protein